MSHTRTQIEELWREAESAADEERALSERLNWFIAANIYEAAQRSLFLSDDDEQEMLLMRRPLPLARAYAFFGLLLGALPSAALLYRIFYISARFNHKLSGLFLFLLLMIVVCLLVGKVVGGRIGRSMEGVTRASWSKMIVTAALYGWWWGIVTGAAGGALAFGVGAIVGASLAVPIGIVGFIIFTILHRLVAHGGMIDARHFWPLACGVTAFIAALILGM